MPGLEDLRELAVAIALEPRGPGGGDFEPSAGSRDALDAALALARAASGSVRLVHVASEADELHASRARALDELASRFRECGLRAQTEIAHGSAHEQSAALARGARALVLGRNDRRGGWPGFGRLGSVARAAIRDAPVHVWLASPDGRCWPPGRILAAVDEDDPHVLAQAVALARDASASLAIVQALTRPPAVQLAGRLDEHRRERALALRAAVKRAAADLAPALDAGSIDVRAGYDAPEHAIESIAAELDTDLCVLGATPRRGLARWLVGTTAERMLDALRGAILVVRER